MRHLLTRVCAAARPVRAIRLRALAGGLAVTASVLVGTAGLARSSQAQVAVNVGGQPDMSDPATQAAMEAAMEDAFDNMPFDCGDLAGGEGGLFGAATASPMTDQDVGKYSTLLNFTPEQRDAAKVIFKQRMENYQERAKAVREEMSKAMKEMMSAIREGGAPEPNKGAQERMEKVGLELQAEQKKMEVGVLEDLKALLTPEQQDLWPKVERARRIDKALRSQTMMMSPGYRVDVRAEFEKFAAARKGEAALPTAATTAVSESLGNYELALDSDAGAVLALDEKMQVMGRSKDGQMPDMGAIFRAMGEAGEIAQRVRHAHERVSREIMLALPEGAQAAWNEAFGTASYPKIFRPTHGQRVLAAALKFEDLTDEQRTTLTALSEKHNASLAALRPKAVTELVEQQEKQNKALKEGGGPEAFAATMMPGQAGARQDMKSADTEALKAVRAALNEEQRKRLPKRPAAGVPKELQFWKDDEKK